MEKISSLRYVMTLQELVLQFEAEWIEQNRRRPDLYPIELSLTEWDEHFSSWLEAQHTMPETSEDLLEGWKNSLDKDMEGYL